jgi:hypothetical protein
MKTYLVFNEQEQRWVSKHYEADTQAATAHFRKLGNNAAKLDAIKASLERGKSC